MEFEPHEVRVIDERNELIDKLDKLKCFINSPASSFNLSGERSRLERQVIYMGLYEGVLAERITEFINNKLID